MRASVASAFLGLDDLREAGEPFSLLCGLRVCNREIEVLHLHKKPEEGPQ